MTTATKINRYVPTKLEKSLYTLTRASKILGIKTSQIEFLYPMEGGCLIGLWNDSIFVNKNDFVKQLGLERKARSNGLKVTPNAFDSNAYGVRNEGKDTLYTVETKIDHVSCTCKDYENLVNDFQDKRVLCKHGYAVLATMGLSTLSDYLNFKQQETRFLDEYDYRTMGGGY